MHGRFGLLLTALHMAFALCSCVGLYRGTVVTCIRDIPSYGVYFWVYEACR